MNVKNLRLLLIFVLSILMFHCSSPTKIDEIKKHPREYVGKEVIVKGEVKDVFSIGFINYFELQDETGAIYVISTNPLPTVGENLKIAGEVIYYTFAKERVIAIKEKEIGTN